MPERVPVLTQFLAKFLQAIVLRDESESRLANWSASWKGTCGYVILSAFLWIDSSRSLRYTGSPAHTGEAYSSTDPIMLQYSSTRSGGRSPFFFNTLRPKSLLLALLYM